MFCIIPLLWVLSVDGAEANQANIARIEFANTPLSDAVDFFRAKSIELQPAGKRINFIVDPEVDPQQLISLRLSNVPIGAAIVYMIDYADLDYRIDSHACFILPGGQGELAKRRPLEPAVTAGFKLSKMARQIVLEKIEFNAAPLDEVINFITQKSAEVTPGHRGINMILSRRVDPVIPVSLQMENVPISRVLAKIANQTAIEIRIEKYAVFLDPPGTRILQLARIEAAQSAPHPSAASSPGGRGGRPSLGTPPNDPRSPAHPKYIKSTDPDVRKRTNALNNVYKWVNGKWTFVKSSSTALDKSELQP